MVGRVKRGGRARSGVIAARSNGVVPAEDSEGCVGKMHTRSTESVGLDVYRCRGPRGDVPVPHIKLEYTRAEIPSPN
jgi:hypothetical protein